MDKKTVVAGGHGPVPMAENSRRYIDREPVTIDLHGPHGTYYARRMMSGELIEYVAPATSDPRLPQLIDAEQRPAAGSPMTMVASMPIPGAATLSVPSPAEKKEEE